MSVNTSEVVGTLSHLITTCKDGQKGFKEAAEAVKREDMKAMFTEFSNQRAQFAAELQTEVNRLGDTPPDGGTPLAALHRGWINLKDAITGHDDTAILSECERGEDAAVDTYEDAMKEPLPEDIAQIVRRQYEGIKAAHDRVRSLRNAGRAEAL